MVIAKIKGWFYAMTGLITALVVAYLLGRAKTNEPDLKPVKKAKEVQDEVESMDDAYLVESARKWLRKDK